MPPTISQSSTMVVAGHIAASCFRCSSFAVVLVVSTAVVLRMCCRFECKLLLRCRDHRCCSSWGKLQSLHTCCCSTSKLLLPIIRQPKGVLVKWAGRQHSQCKVLANTKERQHCIVPKRNTDYLHKLGNLSRALIQKTTKTTSTQIENVFSSGPKCSAVLCALA